MRPARTRMDDLHGDRLWLYVAPRRGLDLAIRGADHAYAEVRRAAEPLVQCAHLVLHVPATKAWRRRARGGATASLACI